MVNLVSCCKKKKQKQSMYRKRKSMDCVKKWWILENVCMLLPCRVHVSEWIYTP